MAKITSVWYLNCEFWTGFTPCSSALLFDFEYVNVDLVNFILFGNVSHRKKQTTGGSWYLISFLGARESKVLFWKYQNKL